MRRAKWGIGAAVVVGLAWLASNFFNMGGIGTGEGPTVGLPKTGVDVPPEMRPVGETTDDVPPQSEPAIENVSTDSPKDSIGEGGVVEVLIDDRDYFVRRGTGATAEWVPADLNAIASYARQAAGDDTGVRLRVFRKPSARATVEEQLMAAVREVGVTPAEIDTPETLVE